MPSTTAATDPVPYYEVLSTFWAAACTARGTDLRGESLINFEVLGAVPKGFIAELGSKRRPAGIEHGFRQAGSGESAGIDVADADTPVPELAAATGELDQVKPRRSAFVVPVSGLLGLATVVPDMVYRPSLPLEMPTGGCILDPVPVREHHGDRVVEKFCENETDAKHAAGIFTLDPPPADAAIATLNLAKRRRTHSTCSAARRSRIRRVLHLPETLRADYRAPPLCPERRRFRRGEVR